ncbi:hypothetical protein INF49_19940 [Enterobacter cloacae complex sp. P8RS]|nr:hypothetical protein [Enterobacter cloacae complex sp. P8RS]HEJ0423761.1 hypothetical protein [Citrobacter koseri]
MIKKGFLSIFLGRKKTTKTSEGNEEGAAIVPNFNKMYSLFNPPNEPDSIIGKIAYCLYKESKQKFITEFTIKNKRPPTEEELDIHVQCSEMPKVGFYKHEARNIFSELQIVITKRKENELEKKFRKDLWDFVNTYEPTGFLERQSSRFKALMFGGIGGVIGNFLTTLLIILIFFFSASSLTQDNLSRNAKENIISGFAQILGLQVDIQPSSNN